MICFLGCNKSNLHQKDHKKWPNQGILYLLLLNNWAVKKLTLTEFPK